ncbi:MAG: hypothetical protein P4L35_03925 [Ignavibacteriaceae bacterium]|nr:hypothetical protein [Ignavibacteriaceae bacterium]
MSSLVLEEYSQLLVDGIKNKPGVMSSPIWLLANPKYSAARRHIWTPILEEIQDKVYRKFQARIDSEKIYIKNVASDIGIVSNSRNCGVKERTKEILMFRKIVCECQPKIIITFGNITYEYVRRVFELRSEDGPQYWSSTNLGDEFERSIADFDINRINVIPIHCRVMKSGKLFEDPNYYCGSEMENYFHDIGSKIADRIIENKDSLKIWIE